jgi:hypothetical protein
MPESLSAFCSIVSLTAANTSRMFDVSVACVRLAWSGMHSGGVRDIILTEDTDSGEPGLPD